MLAILQWVSAIYEYIKKWPISAIVLINIMFTAGYFCLADLASHYYIHGTIKLDSIFINWGTNPLIFFTIACIIVVIGRLIRTIINHSKAPNAPQ